MKGISTTLQYPVYC